jgi:hypothetical protein
VPTIDHKVNQGNMTLNKLGEDRRALQDVGVVVGSRYTKEGVLNPEIMGSHCLKYHSAAFFVTLVHSLPGKRTVLPFLMYVVNAFKHPRKSSSFIESEDLSSVLDSG